MRNDDEENEIPNDELTEELFDDEELSEALRIGAPGETEYRTVTESQAGWRLDLFLVHHFPQYSRVLLRKAIQSEGVFVDGKRGKPAFRLVPGQKVEFTLVELPRESPIPEDIPLDVLYEDDDLAVINKPSNMVVHPSRGHWSGTLVSALAFRYAGTLSGVRGPTRPGIVHRLDRDTSGAILIAKNDFSHARLAAQFEEKKIQKEYFAIILGNPEVDRDLIDLPIGHHPKNREKMRIARDDPEAKTAQTWFEVLDRYRGFSTILAKPRTGRTHQIRVHMAHYGHPILCDRLYGGRAAVNLGELKGSLGQPIREDEPDSGRIVLARQALHARRITFEHPTSGKIMTVDAPLASDMAETLEAICQYRQIQK